MRGRAFRSGAAAYRTGMDDRRSVDVGGVRLAFRVSGPPGAQPLVLLHALGEDATDWDGVAPALAASRRVYALDLRGHGRSDWPACTRWTSCGPTWTASSTHWGSARWS